MTTSEARQAPSGWRLALVWLACVLSTSVSAKGQGTLPLVNTALRIVAPDFRQNLSPQQILTVENEVGTKLAEEAGRKFPFLRWGRASATPISARLSLSLEAEPGPFAPSIFLVFTAESGNTRRLLRRVLLYSPSDGASTHNPAQLSSDIRRKLEELFGNEDFRASLHSEFLKGVPIASQVVVDSTDRVLVVPLPYKDLRPAADSVLSVSFTSETRRSDGTPELKDGLMELKPFGEYHQTPQEGSVQCKIALFSFRDITLALGGWHQDIATIFSPPGLRSLKIFVKHYVEDVNLGSDGPLVINPQ